jgi:uncharacterized protein YndB with AHSA1/START domain
MTKSEFVYTTYIKTTPQKLWEALTNPEFTRQYWMHDNVSDWKKGSEWKHTDGKNDKIIGRVLESNPPRRLVLSWAEPADKTDDSQVAFEIEAIDDMVRLDVIHGGFKAGSKLPSRISKGWPLVLSSLKSFLETGNAIDIWAVKSMGCGNPPSSSAA